MTTPELLRSAAEEVRKGWIRGTRHTSPDRAVDNVCALGALENALGGAHHRWLAEAGCPDAITALADLLPLPAKGAWSAPGTVAHGAVRIAEWNNAVEQTAENVAATMEFAAICLEQATAQPAAPDAVDPVPGVVAMVRRA